VYFPRRNYNDSRAALFREDFIGLKSAVWRVGQENSTLRQSRAASSVYAVNPALDSVFYLPKPPSERFLKPLCRFFVGD